MRSRRGLPAAALVGLLALTGGACGEQEPPRPPVVTVALPVGATPAAVAAAQPLAAALSRVANARVLIVAPAGPDALAASIRSGKVDAALLSQASYAALETQVPVRVVARGALPSPAPVILCGQSSGVPLLTDGARWDALRGRTVLFGPSDSLGRNAWPRYYMARNGITPVGDLDTARVVPAERQALLDVYNGIADCAAASSDSRSSIADIAPDAGQRLTVTFTSPAPVPPPPVILRRRLEPGLQHRLADALLAVQPGTPASAALTASAGYASLQPAADADYAALRAVLRPR